MGARESRLWQFLRAAKLQKDLHRVENSVESGGPDVEGIVKGRMAFHIELKRAERPARSTTPLRIKWQPGQADWLRRRWSMGGACWVLLGVGDGGRRALYLIRGELAGQMELGVTESWCIKHCEHETQKPTAEQVLLAASTR